jgi:hypothetical protein
MLDRLSLLQVHYISFQAAQRCKGAGHSGWKAYDIYQSRKVE